MNKYILFVATALLLNSSLAQTNLQPAEVEAFRLKSPEKLTTGVIYSIDSAAIKSHGSSDLSRALNSMPGVKMETRGEGGSRRIQVRGSSLRSPYSIRNSMLLIDGFVFTEADGNSPVEWLDPEIVSNIRVVTGPAAASYGGAYGGAIIAESNNPKINGRTANCLYRLSTTGRLESHSSQHPNYRLGGNLGLQSRLCFTNKYYSENLSYSLSIISAENPGFRDWEWNTRDQFYFKGKSFDQKDGQHNLIAGLYMGAWALPGALNDSISNASPTTSPGIAYNAFVNRERFILGYGYEKTTASNIKLNASVLGRYTTKVNPYGTSPGYFGYKEESGMGLSILVSSLKTKELNDKWDFQVEATLMHLRDNNSLAEWESEPSLLTVVIPQRYDLEFAAEQTFVSSSLILTNNDNFRIEAQIGVNHRNRLTDGHVFIEDTSYVLQQIEYNVPKKHTSLLPRMGFSFMPTETISLFGQISTGFSDPTAFELVDVETLMPADLESETSLGQELGFRINLKNNFKFKATGYNQRVNNAIMHITQANDQLAFENVDGGLIMRGLELETSWSNDMLSFRGYSTLTKHKFGEDAENANNTIPGTPAFTGGVQTVVNFNPISIYADFRHVGETEILNNNEAQTDPYSLLDLSLNCEVFYDFTFELGCRNILDATYSNWPQINGVYGKLYNPAPPRTIYFSITRPI